MGGRNCDHFGSQSGSQSGFEGGDDCPVVEVITGRMRRRSWTAAEKAAIVAESLEPGVKVTAVARRHRITRGLLWEWRRLVAAGDTAGAHFVPLRVAASGDEPRPGIVPDAVADPVLAASEGVAAGSIDIELGRARVRVRGSVDLRALRQVLVLIGRRR